MPFNKMEAFFSQKLLSNIFSDYPKFKIFRFSTENFTIKGVKDISEKQYHLIRILQQIDQLQQFCKTSNFFKRTHLLFQKTLN